MKLSASLYFDEDVDPLVATFLHHRSYDVVVARDIDMLTRSDTEQLNFAIHMGRCLVTHNRRDFEKLHREYLEHSKAHYGIILAVRRSPHDVSHRIARLLNSLTADEIANQLFYV